MRHQKLASGRPTRLGVALKPTLPATAADEPPRHIPNEKTWPRRMYAIAFDLDTTTLERTYHNASWRTAYEDIRRVLVTHHFDRQEGSVYLGDADKVDPVRCVLAVQDLTRQFPWLASAVNDIRMLRIEENNDLRPAIEDMVAALDAARQTPGAAQQSSPDAK